MKASISVPRHDVPVRAEVDVLVCGGGPAGILAAYAATRAGARTMLVERHGFLGGVNTAACVNGMGGWQYDLDGRPLLAGLTMEIMRGIAAVGGVDPEQVQRLSQPRENGPDYRDGGLGCYWIGTHAEYVKAATEEMLEKAGTKLIYHALACTPILEGESVRGVFVESKSGREAILADIVVDCTGDGDIAARAGADFALGRPGDKATQPMSTIYFVGNSKVAALNYNLTEEEDKADPLVRNRYEGAIRLARERGDITLNPNDVFCSADSVDKRHPDAVRQVNFTRIQKRSSIDALDLTQAEIEGRRQVFEAIKFQRKYMPGCEDAFLISTPAQIGIRESRRILGNYVLTGDDVLNGADFDDTVMRGIYLMDIHNPSEIGKPSVLKMLDQPYSIPYRCLVPHEVNGLLVAGRCISGDHTALASYRIQSHCMALGEAAGTAAALCSETDTEPRALDIGQLRQALLNNGVNLGVDKQ